MFSKKPRTKTGVTVSDKQLIWPKNVFAAAKINTSVTNLARRSNSWNLFKPFSILNFAMIKWFCRVTCFVEIFSLKQFHNIVVHVSIGCYHFFIVEIVDEIRIWCRCQNRIEKYYHHNAEQSGFYKMVHTKTHTQADKKKDVLVIFVLQETKNFNLFKEKPYSRQLENAIVNMKKVGLDES